MLIASHTMPGPSTTEINTAILLIVVCPVVVSCLLTAVLAPGGSAIRRGLATVVGVAVGTATLILATFLAIFAAVVAARQLDNVANWVFLAAGGVLLAVLGTFCLLWSVRATQTVCVNWRAGLSETPIRGSHDRLLAGSWAVGLLMGLLVAIATTTELPIAIGAMGGILIAAGFILLNRGRQHRLPGEYTIGNQEQPGVLTEREANR